MAASDADLIITMSTDLPEKSKRKSEKWISELISYAADAGKPIYVEYLYSNSLGGVQMNIAGGLGGLKVLKDFVGDPSTLKPPMTDRKTILDLAAAQEAEWQSRQRTVVVKVDVSSEDEPPISIVEALFGFLYGICRILTLLPVLIIYLILLFGILWAILF